MQQKFDVHMSLNICTHDHIKMPSIDAIRLTTKGQITKAVLQIQKTEYTLEDAQAFFNKKAKPEILGHYNYKELIVYIIGYSNGKTGTDNKTPLPKPYDKLIFFGDALMVASGSQELHENTVHHVTNMFPHTHFEEFTNAVTGIEAGRGPADEDEDEDEALAEFDEGDEEDEEETEEVDDALEDEEVEAEVEPEIEPEEKPKRKKKIVPLAILSGFQKQSLLIVSEGGLDLQPDTHAKERDICVSRFKFLEEHGFSTKDISNLEQEIYHATLTEAAIKHIYANWKNPLFTEIHGYRQYKLFSNLHPQSPVGNKRLLTRLKERELTMADLARLDDMELYPENWKRLQDLQTIREQKLLEGKMAAATDMFKCNRCGKRETTYYEMQTRSADEPMTIFITCLNCGKKWKQ